MVVQIVILLALLLGINLGWYWAERCRKKYEKAQIEELRIKHQENGETVTEDDLRDEIEPRHIYAGPRAIAICLDIWIGGAIVTHLWAHFFFEEVDDSNNKRALFGDSFGAVNALISAFAFAGMLVAFFMQRYELRLQRKELQLTRDEMNEQTKQFKKQNNTLLRERFESTFFHMMELHQQIVNELSTNQTEEIRKDLWNGSVSFSKDFHVDENIRGRNLFFHAFCNIIHEVPIENSDEVRKLRGMKEVMEILGFAYYESFTTPTYFDHYFRHLYTILKFIDSSSNLLTEEEQYQYAKILRSTLSRYELVWLYYNGLSGYGNEKLKPMIEDYCMLKNLRTDLLCCGKENREKLSEAGKTLQMAGENGFSGTDYEFFLTSTPGDKTKYNVKAFYKTFAAMAKGRTLVSSWNAFMKK